MARGLPIPSDRNPLVRRPASHNDRDMQNRIRLFLTYCMLSPVKTLFLFFCRLFIARNWTRLGSMHQRSGGFCFESLENFPNRNIPHVTPLVSFYCSAFQFHSVIDSSSSSSFNSLSFARHSSILPASFVSLQYL